MTTAAQQAGISRRASVLLVEDNPADANLVEEALLEARLEYQLQTVDDGAKALALIGMIESGRAPVPDLVLLDLNLPRTSGEEVLKRLRRSPSCQNVKVLIVTSSNAPMERKHMMELGATDYFRKPSTFEEFLELGPKVSALLQS